MTSRCPLARFVGIASALVLSSVPALAHTGVGGTGGFAMGFVHPLAGLDHVLAMFTVGTLAAQRGGRWLWLLPAVFVSFMVAGAGFGRADVPLPFVEQGILGSVVLLGLVVFLGARLPLAAVASLAAVAALLHGHAHGTEMAGDADGLVYGAGFASATALLHAAGIGLTLATLRVAERTGPFVVRAIGAATALAGIALVAS